MLSEAEFNTAYQQYAKLISRSIMRLVNNAAAVEDLLQETFIRFLQNADPGKPELHKSFLFHISHNLAIDYLKKNSRVNNFASVPEKPQQNNTLSDTECKIMRNQMIDQMINDDIKYSQIFILRVDYDMSYDEISKTLDIPKRSLMRYMENLRIILQDFL